MERRLALKNMAVAMGSLVSLPAWASGWNGISMGNSELLSAGQSAILKSLVQGIIPKTDTPGAGDLKVDLFIQKMIADCYDEQAKLMLVKGVDALDTASKQSFSKPFTDISASQREQLLKELEKSALPDQKAFFGTVKNLTIQGYMSSEYVMTNLTHYELIPARYHGCVPVSI